MTDALYNKIATCVADAVRSVNPCLSDADYQNIITTIVTSTQRTIKKNRTIVFEICSCGMITPSRKTGCPRCGSMDSEVIEIQPRMLKQVSSN
jgi:hypothetical protein